MESPYHFTNYMVVKMRYNKTQCFSLNHVTRQHVLSHAFETSFLLAVWSCHMIKDTTLRLITIIMSHTVEWLLVVACIELSRVGTDRPAKLNAATTHEQMAQKYQTELTMTFN